MTFDEFKVILSKFNVILTKIGNTYTINHFKLIKFEEYITFLCHYLNDNKIITYSEMVLEILKITTEDISILYEHEECCILHLNFKTRYIYKDINKDIYEFAVSVLSKECPIPIFQDWLKEHYQELMND